jgi:tRNA threonylcarbamoyladenosine biosynthesis protein TsaB
MRLLVIDTATLRGSVAALDGCRLLAAVQSEQPMTQAERIVATVDEVLAQAGWEGSSIELVAVGRGPGSFTGVRVGMATAKGLGLALGVPLVGVVSLDAMAAAARELCGDVDVVALLDAKKGELYGAAYGAQGQRTAEPVHIARQQISGWIEQLRLPAGCGALLVGEPVDLSERPGLRHLQAPECDFPGPVAVAKLALARWTLTKSNELEALEPLYVRPPDIRAARSRQ